MIKNIKFQSPTLAEYNNSRLSDDKLLTGKEYRRLRRKNK